jgi:glycine hydroxymethyltransferase
MLIDMIGKGVTGKAAEAALGKAHITVNKNAVPNDPQKPFVTSGLRIGTPALTTRGMREGEMRRIGDWIRQVLEAPADETIQQRVRDEVGELCGAFPLYVELARAGA